MDGGKGNSVVIGGYRDVAPDVAWIGFGWAFSVFKERDAETSSA